MKQRPPNKQNGVAIITALLIVALATTISAGIATSLQLEVRRTANLLNNDQALMYVKPSEMLAQDLLQEDRRANTTDHLGEDWARDMPPFDIDGVQIVGKITDLQACFNLNALSQASNTPQGNAPSNVTAVQRFQLLLTSNQLNPGISDAVIDWMDADVNTTIPDGAEDGYYMVLEKPYRTANQPFLSTSSLRLVRGFEDNEKLSRLLPSLCAFGVAANINVNTAPESVLSSLANNIDVSAIINARNSNGGFDSLNDFLQVGNLNQQITAQNRNGLSVDSEYFLLTTHLKAGSVTKTVYSIINRTPNAETTIIRRSQGVL